MKKSGLVFSIEEFSTFDGPGIRTSVFLKGCPLRCSWCHNPEGQSFEKQIVRSPNGCINCGRCTKKAIELTGKSDLVYECIDACPNGLIRESGTEYSAEELCEKIIRNEPFYTKTGGGVTFSGGEPLAQSEFLYECLSLFEGKVNRCLQTSGFAQKDIFEKILTKCDYVLFDLKVLDKQKCERYTGADIDVIMTNFDLLAKSGVPFTVRIPLIPGVSDTKDNLQRIIDVLCHYKIKHAQALPYNKLAGAKYAMCQRKYEPDFDTEREIFVPDKMFLENGIELEIL